MKDKNMLEDLIRSPLAILLVKDQNILDKLDNLIPYSTGFEIECHKGEYYSQEAFTAIPDIMEVINGSGEQRYRIPNGIRGMICLYFICYNLKLNSLLNPLSGIHYHVDCTDCYDELSPIVARDKEKILSQLDEWDFRGVQRRGISNFENIHDGSWLRKNPLGTLEYRVGNMTFDYNIILDKIIRANKITKEIKDQITIAVKPTFIAPDPKIIVPYYKALLSQDKHRYERIFALNKKLEELTKDKEVTQKKVEDIKSMFRKRLHRINLD